MEDRLNVKLGKLFKAAVGVVTIPVAVVKDVVTLGAMGRPQSYTAEKIDKIEEDLDESTD